MRLILMLLVAAGGYHFVGKALDDRSAAQPQVQAQNKSAESGNSVMSWIDAARSLLNGAKSQASATVDEATAALPHDTRSKLSGVSQNVSNNLHIGGSNCGEPDRFGNLKYCFHDDKH
ncbi:hypothetical protein [Ralstonia pseudosolanacearum]|uniref:hypothetical protein n=1 Tax=Ralstonia pseudosolanacearum TaxID=1310165 RepID=UPI003CEB685F